MPFSHEFLQSFVETELTMRRQFLLRGYELGRGGGRLGPEEAVAFLDRHFSPVYADVIAATREEQRDFQRASETMLKDTEAWYRQIGDMVEGKLDEASQIAASARHAMEALLNYRVRYQTTRADALAYGLIREPMLVAIRKDGRRGIALVQRQRRTWWQRLRRRRLLEDIFLTAQWQDGTTSVLPDDENVDWWPMILPDQLEKQENP